MRAVFGALGTFTGLALLGCSAADSELEAPSLAKVSAALDASTVVATSYDDSAAPVHIQIRTSAGSTVPYLTQVRKMPGSHGLCNPGNSMLASMDSCVASICSARSQCCSTSAPTTAAK